MAAVSICPLYKTGISPAIYFSGHFEFREDARGRAQLHQKTWACLNLATFA
jgi:hypothetical protein